MAGVSCRIASGKRGLMRWAGGRLPGRGIDIDFMTDIDAQDTQDEIFLHMRPARAMIRCALAEFQDCKLAVS